MIWLSLCSALAGGGIGAGAVLNIARHERRQRKIADDRANGWLDAYVRLLRQRSPKAWDGQPYSWSSVEALIGKTVDLEER